MTENLELNGVPLESVPPTLLRAISYSHFTSMQFRDRQVRGLDLHLDRLDRASQELFGRGLSADRVLSVLRTALDRAWSPDVSVRITVLGPANPDLDLLVTVSDPIDTTPIGTTTYAAHTTSADLIAKAYAAVPLDRI